ncbi:hypothetical protein BX666DRAFT_2032022 [Dichotomocladium elegans]|nr:hypothetical protein BX666DRAFT_2032022 [Dichotomocladium elegans]
MFSSMMKMSDQRVFELKNYIVTQLELRAEPEETIYSLIESVLNRTSLLAPSADLVSEAARQWCEEWNREHCAVSQQQAMDMFLLATKATIQDLDEMEMQEDDKEAVSRTGGDSIQHIVPLPSGTFTGGRMSDDNDLDLLVPVPWPPALSVLWFPPVATCDPMDDSEVIPPTLWNCEACEEDSDDEDPIQF